ncbi:MAG TPA: hypothetical protein PK544_07720 [Spirochaetota bacterium]|nr:hypothetical protein [Spirochaetota bacterium]HPJ38598.1 hypothetical protein [Spirochaetota bacterium]HPQ54464.1 hypothetical protein [Spirochaetota bacterium]
MKRFIIATAVMISLCSVVSAQAQYAITNDVIFVRAGFIPVSQTSFDEGWSGVNPSGASSSNTTADVQDLEGSGFAVNAEYNLNLGNVWIGFGIEYQRVSSEFSIAETGSTTQDFSEHVNQFIQPMVTAKFVAAGGFYAGLGISGKYLIATEKINSNTTPDLNGEWDSKLDLWGHVVAGFFFPVAEGVYFDVEGRFGINITNNQFESMSGNGPAEANVSPKNSYDIALYVGVGFRALSTGL